MVDIKDQQEIPLNWHSGDTIAGIYKVEGVTAGGMGAVYFVNHLNWNMPLAVKTPLPELVKNESAMRRFIQEAETWIKLGVHPHIATCFYVRIMGGVPRIFIEYVDGGSLKEWIIGLDSYLYKDPPLFPQLPLDNKVVRERKREKERIIKRRLSAGQSLFPASKELLRTIGQNLDLAIQACRGMEYVHKHGVIHRDLKPANCLITKDGLLKVTDFGIAKTGDEIEEISNIIIARASEDNVSITGNSFGTPEYMSPEQFIDAKHVGRESDIYSFGVLLYEMICGKKPFIMPGAMLPIAREMFFKTAHLSEKPIEPIAIWRECHPDLNNLILKCLEKDPENRLASFGEIEEELLKIYGEVTGEFYFRPKSDITQFRSDSLNNKALSFLDLGREEEAENCWEEAQQYDHAHMATTINYGYYQWQRKNLDPCNYFGNVKSLESVHKNNKEYWYSLFNIGLDIGLFEEVEDSLNRAGEYKHELANKLTDITLPLIALFKLDTDSVTSSALFLDGKHAYVGLSNGNINLLETMTGKVLATLSGHEGAVKSIITTVDNQYALSAGEDADIRLWDIKSGECIRVLKGHTDTVSSMAIFPDNKTIVTGGYDSVLRMWDMFSGKCLRTFEGHNACITSVAITPKGKYIISGSAPVEEYDLSGGEDFHTRIWEVSSGNCRVIPIPFSHTATSISVTPDAKRIISGCWDGTLRIYNSEHVKEGWIKTQAHPTKISYLAVTSDGAHILSGGYEESIVKIWNISEGRCVKVFKHSHADGPITSMSLSSDRKYVFCTYYAFFGVEENYVFALWDISLSQKQYFSHILCCPKSSLALRKEKDEIDSLTKQTALFIKTGEYGKAYSVLRKISLMPEFSRDPIIMDQIYNCAKCSAGKQTLKEFWSYRIIEENGGYIQALSIAPDGRYILSGTRFGNYIKLWDMHTFKCLEKLKGGPPFDISPNGQYAVSSGDDNCIKVWDLEKRTCLRTVHQKGHESYIHSLALMPDGENVLSVGESMWIYLYSLKSGDCIKEFKGHTRGVLTVINSTNGKYIVSGSRDGTVRIWNPKTGECLTVLEGNNGPICSLILTPDESGILSGSADGTIRLWEINTGICLREFKKHTDWVSSLAITADGNFIVSGSSDKQILFWDIRKEKPISLIDAHSEAVKAVALTSDDRYIVSGSSDGTLRMWELDWEWGFSDENHA